MTPSRKNLTIWWTLLMLALCGCANKGFLAHAAEKDSPEKIARKDAADKILLEKLSPPPIQREMRGAWIATVANIDWPPRPGMPVEEQKASLIKMYDRAVELRMNTIYMQVRAQCDALYQSSLEPWAPSLTGTMGQAPSPYYDPLEFAVTEAHKRGLELHAWFNPFRAYKKSKTHEPSTNHVSHLHPEFVRDYATHLWLDPGEKAARDYSLSVVLDVTRRYDIDGVHFDDYFYPYYEKDDAKKLVPFPDDQSYQSYTNGGGTLNRSDWRRDNVNQFVQAVYAGVKKEKPWVKVGIAPFGIWKPGAPEGVAGMNAFEELSCDSRKWLQEGWVDYIAPQLYWRTYAKKQPFVPLLKWWVDQNTLGRPIWPGHFTSEIGDKDPKTGEFKMTTDDIIEQVKLTREQTNATGNIQYSMKALMANRGGVSDRLQELYSNAAVMPAFPWLSTNAPAKPRLSVTKVKKEMEINWQPVGSEKVSLWVLQKKIADEWQTEVFPGEQTSVALHVVSGKSPKAFVLTAFNRYGNASPPAPFAFKLKK